MSIVCRWRWVCEDGLTESGDEVICVFGRVEVLLRKSNCICLGGKTDFFEEWKIEYGMKNNFNVTNITLLLP